MLIHCSRLFTGNNSNGQIVHSWVANKTLTTFDMDFAPLLGFLSARNMVPTDVYLGTVQFGTETFSASSQVNFTVTSYEASMRSTKGKSEGTASVAGNAVESGTANGPPVATQVTPTSSGIPTFGEPSVGAAWLVLGELFGFVLAM